MEIPKQPPSPSISFRFAGSIATLFQLQRMAAASATVNAGEAGPQPDADTMPQEPSPIINSRFAGSMAMFAQLKRMAATNAGEVGPQSDARIMNGDTPTEVVAMQTGHTPDVTPPSGTDEQHS